MLTGHPPYGGDTPLAVAYQHVHNDVPAPSAEVPGLPWQVDELVARATRRDPAGRPIDAGAFLAELADVRKDLGIEPVPVPTGRSTAGPGTLRPTNRPDPPAAPQRPGHRRHGPRPAQRPHQHDAGHGRRPDHDVGGRRPGGGARPGVPQHIRRRRARFAVALVLLLAITIGAVGWWLGSGRWTDVPTSAGKSTRGGGRPAAGGRSGPDPVVEQFSETVPAGRWSPSIPPRR